MKTSENKKNQFMITNKLTYLLSEKYCEYNK